MSESGQKRSENDKSKYIDKDLRQAVFSAQPLKRAEQTPNQKKARIDERLFTN